MKLGTSTNLVHFRPDGSVFPLEKSLELMASAGFNSFDLNGYDWALPGSPFLGDDWESWINGIVEKANQLKVTFDQCHAYFYNFLDININEEERERHKLLQSRSFECCKRLGARTIVLHPETDMYTPQNSFTSNIEFFGRLLEKYDVKIAIENMCDYCIAPKRKFCAYPDELMDFISSFNDERIGICWDFEHADIMEQNQREALLLIGKKLFATHVSDTHSKTDSTLMHVLPMTGNINWFENMRTLREIDYQDVFCFEVHNYTRTMPDSILPNAIELAYKIGDYLVNHLGEEIIALCPDRHGI
jgi:sugar phosphate isomerase/epimerase